MPDFSRGYTRKTPDKFVHVLDAGTDSISKRKYSDGDPTTYISEQFIDYKFDSPRFINRIRLMPVNANNGIQPGEMYSLYLWRKNEWELIGNKVAEKNILEYATRERGLFYLKNVTAGQEEMPFTVTGTGEQEFVYTVY